MRLLPWALLASASTLLVGAQAAESSSEEQRFESFRRQARSSPSSILPLDDKSYKSLTTAPRNYSVAVLFTAREKRFACQLCHEFQPEWELLGRSWAKGDPSAQSRLLIATLDFADGRESFVSLGLQSVPALYFHPPTLGPYAAASSEPARFEFTSGTPSAERIQAWLARHMPDRPHPEIRRPINLLRWASTITILLGVFTLLFTARPYVLPIVQSRSVWAAATIIAILLFTSGHMFNHIRSVPYVASDGRGGITYFARGFQNQFGLETQIIAALYGILAFSAIALATKVPRMTKPRPQLIAVLVWSGIIFFLNSFLMSVFRIKNGTYPFSLPPFM